MNKEHKERNAGAGVFELESRSSSKTGTFGPQDKKTLLEKKPSVRRAFKKKINPPPFENVRILGRVPSAGLGQPFGEKIR